MAGILSKLLGTPSEQEVSGNTRSIEELLELPLQLDLSNRFKTIVQDPNGASRFMIHLTDLAKIAETDTKQLCVSTRNTCETYRAYNESLDTFLNEYPQYKNLIGESIIYDEMFKIREVVNSLKEKLLSGNHKRTIGGLIKESSPKNESVVVNYVGLKDFDNVDINKDKRLWLFSRYSFDDVQFPINNSYDTLSRAEPRAVVTLPVLFGNDNKNNTIENPTKDLEIGRVSEKIKEYMEKYKPELKYVSLPEDIKINLKKAWDLAVSFVELEPNPGKTEEIRANREEYEQITSQLNSFLNVPWKETLEYDFVKKGYLEEAHLTSYFESVENMLDRQYKYSEYDRFSVDPILKKCDGTYGIIHYLQSVFTAILLEHKDSNDDNLRRKIIKNIFRIRDEFLSEVPLLPENGWDDGNITEILIRKVLSETDLEMTPEYIQKIKALAVQNSDILDNSEHVTQMEYAILDKDRDLSEGIFQNGKFLIPLEVFPEIKNIIPQHAGYLPMLKGRDVLNHYTLFKKFINSLSNYEEKCEIIKYLVNQNNIKFLINSDFDIEILLGIPGINKDMVRHSMFKNFNDLDQMLFYKKEISLKYLLEKLFDNKKDLLQLVETVSYLKRLYGKIDATDIISLNETLDADFIKKIAVTPEELIDLYTIRDIDKVRLSEILLEIFNDEAYKNMFFLTNRVSSIISFPRDQGIYSKYFFDTVNNPEVLKNILKSIDSFEDIKSLLKAEFIDSDMLVKVLNDLLDDGNFNNKLKSFIQRLDIRSLYNVLDTVPTEVKEFIFSQLTPELIIPKLDSLKGLKFFLEKPNIPLSLKETFIGKLTIDNYLSFVKNVYDLQELMSIGISEADKEKILYLFSDSDVFASPSFVKMIDEYNLLLSLPNLSSESKEKIYSLLNKDFIKSRIRTQFDLNGFLRLEKIPQNVLENFVEVCTPEFLKEVGVLPTNLRDLIEFGVPCEVVASLITPTMIRNSIHFGEEAIMSLVDLVGKDVEKLVMIRDYLDKNSESMKQKPVYGNLCNKISELESISQKIEEDKQILIDDMPARPTNLEFTLNPLNDEALRQPRPVNIQLPEEQHQDPNPDPQRQRQSFLRRLGKCFDCFLK